MEDDRLVIDKFCSIASGATFLLNGGKPARVVRPRFSEADIARLLAIAWWDWPIEKIIAHVRTIALGTVGAGAPPRLTAPRGFYRPTCGGGGGLGWPAAEGT